jgi:membrane protein
MATAQSIPGQRRISPAASTGALAETKERAEAGVTSTRDRLRRHATFRVLESTVRGFVKDRVTSYAAAMVYYGLFSLFPLLLLFLSLAGLALQSNEAARNQIMNVVVGLLPQGQDQLKQVIAGVIDAKGIAAGVGILTLLWSALGWFQVIDVNVNQIWGVNKPRSFIKGKLFALVMVGAIGLVALVSWVATAAIGILAAFTTVIPGSVLLWQALVSALSVLTLAGAFYVLYRYTPRRRIEFGDVWPAALMTALLWEATRRIVAFYLEKNNMISGYGPIGAAMALLFWIYIASVIVLLGAELSYAVAKERRGMGPDDQMRVAAPPGEQPTPKFAPQVGTGFTDPDQSEPIVPAVTDPSALQRQTLGQGNGASEAVDSRRDSPRSAERGGVAQAVASAPESVKTALWVGLAAAMTAGVGLAARRASSGIWHVVMREPPPTDKV